MVSVVIPVYRERLRLPGCLAELMPQAREVSAEVLVVDGGSADGTLEAAGEHSGVVPLSAPRGRGVQMNVGARAARGSLLVFLPADTRLPAGALVALDAIDRSGRPLAGGFRMRFDAQRPALKLIAALHNLRARLTGVFYGDQVPFLRRELFFEVGGFPEETAMEDVEFGSRLRRQVRPRQLDLEVETSARRFDRAGDLRATLDAAYVLAYWKLRGKPPDSQIFFRPVR